MGSNHARVLQSMESVSELICFDEKLQPNSPRLGDAIYVDDMSEVIRKKPDYAVVSTPSSSHEEIAVSLATAGIPALVEKPIAHTEESELRIFQAFQKTGTAAFAGFVERYSGVNLSLKGLLGSGRIGKPLIVESERIGPNPKRISDVGVLLDLGSHDVDLVQWLFGDALSIESSLESHSDPNFGQATTVSLQGVVGGSITVRSLVSWDSPVKSRKIRVIGSEGLVVADAIQGTMSVLKTSYSSSEWESYRHMRGYFDSREERIYVSQKEPLRGEHESIQDFLAGGDSSPCTLEEAVRHMKAIWRRPA